MEVSFQRTEYLNTDSKESVTGKCRGVVNYLNILLALYKDLFSFFLSPVLPRINTFLSSQKHLNACSMSYSPFLRAFLKSFNVLSYVIAVIFFS